MSKPTEGPWYVSADDAHDCPPHKNSGLAMVDTGRASDWPIARLCEWNNVHLIAAAPDLLAALKAQTDWFGASHSLGCPQDDTCDCEGKRVNDLVNSAINKAEGL